MSLSSRTLTGTLVFAYSLSTLLFATQARGALADDKEKELPKSGSLSVTTSGGQSGVSAPSGWGDGDGLGAGSSPIGGSVSRLNAATWQLFVKNSSEDTYSVNLEVIQKDDRGNRVKSDSFSYTLRPGASQKQTVGAASHSNAAELNLRNWRNVTKQKAEKAKVGIHVVATPQPGKGKGLVPRSS